MMEEKKDYTVAYTEDAISMMDERIGSWKAMWSVYYQITRENQEAIFDGRETKKNWRQGADLEMLSILGEDLWNRRRVIWYRKSRQS